MQIEQATREDIFRVAVGMRQADYDEFSAVSFADDRAGLAQSLAERYGAHPDVLCASRDGEPICIGGFVMTRPNVVSLLFFATDDFPRIGLGITRFITRNWFPKLEAAGVHRFEAVSLSTHLAAHAWLGTLGLRPETGKLRNYGRGGEDFILFSKVVDARPSGA